MQIHCYKAGGIFIALYLEFPFLIIKQCQY
jgi:hypothetical protein